ncbi:MAG: ATP-binding cassette domain-containing protein [Bifidobacteriaceae bacterium]|jgi:zinc transport system ATP-binding protein|nr:ATP-binding cassette domain-containing protein [Bifidobacteriaceae bacterium]
MPLAEARSLSVNLGGNRILSGIDLTVAAGDRVGILGANGSGKSTLVKALLGLLPAAQGEIRLFGQEPGRGLPWAKVAYVPQVSPAGSGVPTSALDVVKAGLLTGWRPWLPRGATARAQDALAAVGLQARANDNLASLSGGQRHRVLLARALVRDPELAIMDEPLAGVDADSADRLVAALEARPALTCVVVLHDLGPFERYLRRGIVLSHGRVVADGPLDQVMPEDHHHHHEPPRPHRSHTPELEVRP